MVGWVAKLHVYNFRAENEGGEVHDLLAII